jgi:hypothetical protein
MPSAQCSAEHVLGCVQRRRVGRDRGGRAGPGRQRVGQVVHVGGDRRERHVRRVLGHAELLRQRCAPGRTAAPAPAPVRARFRTSPYAGPTWCNAPGAIKKHTQISAGARQASSSSTPAAPPSISSGARRRRGLPPQAPDVAAEIWLSARIASRSWMSACFSYHLSLPPR